MTQHPRPTGPGVTPAPSVPSKSLSAVEEDGVAWRALIGRAMKLEKHMYASLARGIARRPAIPEGARGFRYDASVNLVLIVLAVLSIIELVVVDLLVHRWLYVRVPLLVLGIWGAVWMLGLLFAHTMRPHTVGPDGISVRDGLDLDLDFSWDDIHSVAIQRRTYPPKSARVLIVDDVPTLVVAVSDQTNVRVVFEQPKTVVLPGHSPKGGMHTVAAVRLWADEPRELLDEVKKHL